MCFFVLLYRMIEDYPVVVAANRDEFLDRPGTPPAHLRPGVLAGKDPRSGGTWLGVNRAGTVAAITNRYDLNSTSDPAAHSRGLLCLALLQQATTETAEDFLQQQLARHRYNEFNLAVVSPHRACAISLIRGRLNTLELPPGLHVIANTLPDSQQDPRVRRGRDLINRALASGLQSAGIEAVLAALGEVCADHGGPSGEARQVEGFPVAHAGPADALCMHGLAHGTLSSSLIAIHRDTIAASRYLNCDGPPCRTPYENFSPLLQSM